MGEEGVCGCGCGCGGVCVCRVEYYSATEKNEILLFTTMWMDLEGIILCEMSEKEKCEIQKIKSSRFPG